MEEPFLLRCKTPLVRPKPHSRLLVKHFIITSDEEVKPERKELSPSLLIQKLISNGGHEEVWEKLMTIQFRSHTKDQIKSILQRNIEYNGKIYFFCGFSNNQLKDKTCFFVHEQDRKTYSSLAASGYVTQSHYVASIERMFEQFERSLQLKEDEFVFDSSTAENTESTGFMSTELAEEVRTECGVPDKPSVLQFICDEFSGVLVHSPGMEDGIKADFRAAPLAVCHSPSRTIGILECSQPFSMGYIDVISMMVLAEKGISSDRFLKLHEHNLRVLENLEDLTYAKHFLRQRGKLDLLRKIENGITRTELDDLDKLREEEIKKIGNKARSTFSEGNFRVFVHRSREVFGIKDPYQQNSEKNLKPGECVFQPSLIPENDDQFESVEEIVVIPRPCCRLEDVMKLRLVKDREEYDHLKDCIVFPSHSKLPLSGNKYFVCWDRELVPPPISWVKNLSCNFAEMGQGLSGVFRTFCYIQQCTCFGYAKKRNHIPSERELQEYFAKYEDTDELVALAESLFIENASLRGTSCSQCQELGKLLSPDFDWNEKRVEAKELLQSVQSNAKESTACEATDGESEFEAADDHPLLSKLSSDYSSSPEPDVWKRMEKRLGEFMKKRTSLKVEPLA